MEGLGINPVLVIAQIISFTILLVVLKKFLYSRIQAALEERREAVKKTFADKAELEAKLVAFDHERAELQERARASVQEIISQAKKDATDLKRQMVDKAAAESEREFNQAKELISQEKIKAQKDIAVYLEDLNKSVITKLLSQQSQDPAWQKKELHHSLSQLAKVKKTHAA